MRSPPQNPSSANGTLTNRLRHINSDLGGFLDAHLTFIESYREILLDVKKNWSNA